LSAPSADQFLQGGFELARLTQPQHKVDFQAPVVLASAPAPEPQKAPIGEPATDESGAPAITPIGLLHQASLKTETREVPATPVAALPQPTGLKSTDRPATAAKPALKKSVDQPGLAAAQIAPRKTVDAAKFAAKKSVDKLALASAKPVTKPVRLARTDPLAPLVGKPSAKTAKDSAPAR
jgi:hypothetical protein